MASLNNYPIHLSIEKIIFLLIIIIIIIIFNSAHAQPSPRDRIYVKWSNEHLIALTSKYSHLISNTLTNLEPLGRDEQGNLLSLPNLQNCRPAVNDRGYPLSDATFLGGFGFIVCDDVDLLIHAELDMKAARAAGNFKTRMRITKVITALPPARKLRNGFLTDYFSCSKIEPIDQTALGKYTLLDLNTLNTEKTIVHRAWEISRTTKEFTLLNDVSINCGNLKF